MTASPKARKPDWLAIQSSAESGVPMIELARRFRVTADAIRQRAKRGGWATPRRVIGKARELLSRNVTKDNAVDISAEALAQIGQRNNQLVARYAGDAIERLARSKARLPVKTWSDMATANKLVRLATGQDKEGSTTQISFGAFWSHPEAVPEKPIVVVDLEG